MRNAPSPLVPSLMVITLGLVITGPLTIFKKARLLLAGEEEEEEGIGISFMLVLPLVLLLVIHLLSVFSPPPRLSRRSVQVASSSYDGEGFGFGTLLLALIFLFLYRWF